MWFYSAFVKRKRQKPFLVKEKPEEWTLGRPRILAFSVLTWRKWCSCSGVLFWCLFLAGLMKCIFIYVQFFWYGKLEIHSLLEWLASAHKSEYGIGIGAGSAGVQSSPSMEAHQAAPCGKRRSLRRDTPTTTSWRWASATTFFFFWFKYYLKREEGKRGKGTKKLYWILVKLGRDPGLPLSLVVKRSSYLRVLCCWLLIAHIRRGSNGLAPSQQYFMSFGGWQLLKHLGWRQEGTCFRRTDLRCSFIHLFSVFWRSRENSRGRLSFPGGWNQQSFGIWVGRGWEVSL